MFACVHTHTHTNTKKLLPCMCTHTHTHTNTKKLLPCMCTHTHTHTNTKELLPRLDLSNAITLGISTCSQEGPTSEIITTDYQGLPHTVRNYLFTCYGVSY